MNFTLLLTYPVQVGYTFYMANYVKNHYIIDTLIIFLGRYCYEPYPTVTKSNANNTNSLKRDKNTQSTQKTAESSCNCLGKKTKKKSKAFFTGVATNLGICILLFGYTLIGSVIFLSIEGNISCFLFLN